MNTIEMHKKISRLALAVAATLAFAFFIRLSARLAFGEQYFWRNSYFDYYAQYYAYNDYLQSNGASVFSYYAYYDGYYGYLYSYYTYAGY